MVNITEKIKDIETEMARTQSESNVTSTYNFGVILDISTDTVLQKTKLQVCHLKL